ncbi:tetratricopeptide repeat protein [Thermodesulfobacteriota bacterium]
MENGIDITLDPGKKMLWARLGIMIIVCFLAYSNTFQSPLTFDDGANIRDNHHIRLSELTWKGISEAAFKSPLSNRPVANVSFALNYYFHQHEVLGYHLVNLILHITTGILLYFFIGTTLKLPSVRAMDGPAGWVPFFAALIWLVHPLQTQSVTYIVQRMNSMAACFYVLAFLLYVKARQSKGGVAKGLLFTGCGLAAIMAMGSKETSATLPFFIFLYEWYFFQELNIAWLKRHARHLAAILLVLALLALLYLGADPLETVLAGYGHRDFNMVQRVLTQFRVVLFYLGLLIFPFPARLNLVHDFPLSHSLTDPVTTLLSMGFVLGLFCVAVFLAKKERLLSFCIFWFLGNLVIESSIIGLEMVFEHRTYLPSMLMILVFVVLLYRAIPSRRLGMVILCAMTIIFSVWTYARNSVWRDNVTLWTDCVIKSPGKPRAHLNLGRALAGQGKYKSAVIQFTEALGIKPDYAKAHNNLGAALASQKKYDQAIVHYTRALQIKPGYAKAHNNLGAALANQKKYGQAIAHLTEALRIKPDYESARRNLALVLQIIHRAKSPPQGAPAR